MGVYFKLFAAAVIWGGTFVAGRVVAPEVDPYGAAFLRYVIASVALLAITAKKYGTLPRLARRQWLAVLALSATGVISYNICFFKGLNHIAASRASLIIATNPVMIALMAALIFKERLRPIQIVGVALSVFGAMVVITRGTPATILTGALGWGELFIAGAVVSWVTFSLLGVWILSDLSPLVAVSYASAMGTIGLLGPAWQNGIFGAMGHFSLQAWLSLIYLGLLGTAVAFVWYYQGIQQVGPTRSGLFINFVPVSAVALAIIILNEPLSFSLLLGAATVTAGVYLTRTPPRAKSLPAIPPART